jgi:hypothetical protein
MENLISKKIKEGWALHDKDLGDFVSQDNWEDFEFEDDASKATIYDTKEEAEEALKNFCESDIYGDCESDLDEGEEFNFKPVKMRITTTVELL